MSKAMKWKKLDYTKPKFIHWKVIAGDPKLSFYESYDVVFDEYDLKIRGLIK